MLELAMLYWSSMFQYFRQGFKWPSVRPTLDERKSRFQSMDPLPKVPIFVAHVPTVIKATANTVKI